MVTQFPVITRTRQSCCARLVNCLRENGPKEEWYLVELSSASYRTASEVFAQLEATGVQFEEQSVFDNQRVKRGPFSWPNTHTVPKFKKVLSLQEWR